MEPDASDADEPSIESKPMVDGRYRLEAELGRGGMGRVWRARDTRLDRVVAVKELLLPAGMDAEERQRLATRMEREARAAAMGSHPGIVAVHDVVEHDGRPWIVMQFLTGQSLQDLVARDGPCSPFLVSSWLGELVDALVTAHELGVVHRDVKPANVMITDTGRAVLTDFGIAQISGASELTGTVGIIGSPGYIAPERLRFAPATAAADLWSLGATLYYALEGVAPFQRDSVEATVRAALDEEAPPARVQGTLAQLMEGLLRKDPARRLDAQQVRTLLSLLSAATDPATSAPAGPAMPVADVAGGSTEVVAAQPTSVHLPAGAPAGRNMPASGPSTGTEVRPSRLSWPLVAMVLGAGALIVVGVAILVFATREDGTESMAAEEPTAAEADDSAAESEDEEDGDEGEDAASPSAEETPEETPSAEPPPGTSLVTDPEGFDIVVPDGWTRRVDGPSVFYDAPESGVYLQIDTRPHPNSDQMAHVEQSEAETIGSGRLPDYERLRMADVTDTVPGEHLSVSEWQFEWTGQGERRQILTRNFTLADGDFVTVGWAAPSAEWDSYDEFRVVSLDSFDP